MREVWITGAARTAIGDFGGGLKDVAPIDLGATVVKAVLQRSGVDGSQVGHLAFGHVIHTEPRDMYLSRVVAINGGLPQSSAAFNVNRLCGSGLQAIVSSAQSILLGDTEMAIGGGAESMSRAGYLSQTQRFGARMGDSVVLDMMTGALHDPFGRMHMGVTAENVANQFGISRAAQDALATESHRRAVHAQKEGRFNDQIVPVVIKTRKGEVEFKVDEHPRADVSVEGLTALRPVFVKENGTVTAGNASGINDGAALVLLASAEAMKRHALSSRARVVGAQSIGCDPSMMGLGPVAAVQALCGELSWNLSEVPAVEINEAFAAQTLAVIRQLDLDPNIVNPVGGAIALGHPLGATGAIRVATLLHGMRQRQLKYGMVTMCIGTGMGAAGVFERL
jgi:acetyl-CoA C-acetyltransferase